MLKLCLKAGDLVLRRAGQRDVNLGNEHQKSGALVPREVSELRLEGDKVRLS